MIDRRKCIYSVGSVALAATISLESMALDRMALPRRAIPGGDESLAIVGLGNAKVFYESDMETSREIISRTSRAWPCAAFQQNSVSHE